MIYTDIGTVPGVQSYYRYNPMEPVDPPRLVAERLREDLSVMVDDECNPNLNHKLASVMLYCSDKLICEFYESIRYAAISSRKCTRFEADELGLTGGIDFIKMLEMSLEDVIKLLSKMLNDNSMQN